MSEVEKIPQENLSFVLHGIDDVRFEKRPNIDPSSLGPYEILVTPRKTGICGSDVHYLKHGAIGDFRVENPMVLGHESSGIVLKVGSNVTSLASGDRVALEPGATCGRCSFCKGGTYEHCASVVFAATPPYDGTLAGEYRLPDDLCYKLPEAVSFEEGAMIEPLSVGVNAIAKVAKMKANENICVFGAGPVGLLTMAAAKALGAKRIIAIDIQQERLDFARSYCATDIFTPGKPNEGESKVDYSKRTADEIIGKLGLQDSGPESVSVVVDCSGAETCIQTGLLFSLPAVDFGMGNPNVVLPIGHILTKAITIVGSFRYGAGVYSLALDLVAQGKVSLGPLITHRYKFTEAKAAFEDSAAGKGKDGKMLIKAIISGPVDGEKPRDSVSRM